MKFLSKNIHQNFIKIKIEDIDDLWWLNNLIEEGDLIKTKTYRRKRLEEVGKSEREQVIIKICVEKFDFDGKRIHVIGRIVESSDEDIPLHSYHSFNISIDDIIVIEKIFNDYHIEILKEAEKGNFLRQILIIVVDVGAANIALLKDVKVEYFEISRNIGGKRNVKGREKEKNAFYNDILNFIKKFSVSKIILGGAGFEKENFLNFLRENDKEISKICVIENTGNCGINGIKEIIGRSKHLINEINVVEDAKFVNALMFEISKDGLYCYSLDDVRNALNYNAVDVLLLTNKFFNEHRKECAEIIKEVRNKGGRIHISDSENEAGMQLDALGGIAGLLRFKI